MNEQINRLQVNMLIWFSVFGGCAFLILHHARHGADWMVWGVAVYLSAVMIYYALPPAVFGR